MVATKSCQILANDVPARRCRGLVLAARPGLYILLVLTAVLSLGAYSVRAHGIFACSAAGYGSDRYLSYCNGIGYGDYDHGAIWFGLEPAASTAAANAQVLFLGNSRTVFGFSSEATADWFSSRSLTYFLLGFSHNENYTFEAPLLRKIHPKAKVYVINIDSFFQGSETGPGKTVMRDESAKTRYEGKREWQSIHKTICTRFKAVCGSEGAFFRSRSVGDWTVTGGPFPSGRVSYNEDIDDKMVASYTELGRQFLPGLSADRACTILTIVPTAKTQMATAKATAAALGFDLVAPRLTGLTTIDQVHLDPISAQRWSSAFLEQAGPQIQECLNERPEAQVAIRGGMVSSHQSASRTKN
jgi:hypothetical protein